MGEKLDRGGVTTALVTFFYWGLIPIYYKALQAVDPWEVLAHRVIWSVPVLLIFLFIRDGWSFREKLRLPVKSVAWLVLSGLTISINWMVFVWAIANDHVLDTSLGYFVTPVVSVLFGCFFLKERLPALQLVALALAAAGTVYLGWYLGKPPWIAIALAVSFSFYALLRKRLDVGPMVGLLWETSLMLLPALVYLLWLSSRSSLQFLAVSMNIDLLLIFCGLTTILPLIGFNMAARKLPLSILSFFQYIAPSMTFLLAVYLYGESFTFGHVVAFVCIWLALAVVSIEPFRRARRRLSA